MRHDRAWSTSKRRRHQRTLARRLGKPHGIDTLVKPVKAPRLYPPMRRSPLDVQRFQLPERHHPMLPSSYPRDLSIYLGPTGRYVKAALTYRPVGGKRVGHALRVEGAGARVVRWVRHTFGKTMT